MIFPLENIILHFLLLLFLLSSATKYLYIHNLLKYMLSQSQITERVRWHLKYISSCLFNSVKCIGKMHIIKTL